jgi:hypothetical protein
VDKTGLGFGIPSVSFSDLFLNKNATMTAHSGNAPPTSVYTYSLDIDGQTDFNNVRQRTFKGRFFDGKLGMARQGGARARGLLRKEKRLGAEAKAVP